MAVILLQRIGGEILYKTDSDLDRDEISFNEVYEKFKLNERNIFKEAELGNLTIWLRPPHLLDVRWLCSVTQAALRTPNKSANQLSDEDKKDLRVIYPQLKGEITDDALIDAIEMSKKLSYEIIGIEPDDIQEIIYIPRFSYYPNKGKYRFIYCQSVVGSRPLSQLSIDMFLRGNHGAGIYLGLTNDFGISDNSDETFFIIPKPRVTFNDALKGDMFFVKKKDMQDWVTRLSLGIQEAKSNEVDEEETIQSTHCGYNASPTALTKICSDNKPKAGLPTRRIALLFQDISMDFDEWKSTLADPPDWLAATRIHKGRRGKNGDAIWDPFEIATRLIEKKDSNEMLLKIAFNRNLDLAPWAEEWKDYLDRKSSWNQLN